MVLQVSTSTVPSLTGLPVELFNKVFEYTDDSDILTIRQVCRELSAVTFEIFGKTFFRRKKIILLRQSLQRLLDISEHPTLSSFVQEITIVEGMFDIGTRFHEWKPATDWDTYWAYYGLAHERKNTATSGLEVEFLATAVDNLTNLRCISFDSDNAINYAACFDEPQEKIPDHPEVRAAREDGATSSKEKAQGCKAYHSRTLAYSTLFEIVGLRSEPSTYLTGYSRRQPKQPIAWIDVSSNFTTALAAVALRKSTKVKQLLMINNGGYPRPYVRFEVFGDRRFRDADFSFLTDVQLVFKNADRTILNRLVAAECWTYVRGFLQAASNLEHLSVHVGVNFQPRFRGIDLSQLRTLEISKGRATFDDIMDLLSRTPRLESFRAETVTLLYGQWRAIMEYLQRMPAMKITQLLMVRRVESPWENVTATTRNRDLEWRVSKGTNEDAEMYHEMLRGRRVGT